MILADSHCHLSSLDYTKLHANIFDVLKKAKKNYVNIMLNVSVSLENFKFILQDKNIYSNVWNSCGIHPLNCQENDSFKELENLSKTKKVVALGETGLDFFSQKKYNARIQKKSFREHIRLGIKLSKPIIVHMRNSSVETLKILKEEKAEICKGVIHSFTEGIDIARKILDMDLFISFSGIATFKNSEKIREVVKYVPIEKMLIETDSPYLTPVPFRGKENQPAYLYNTAKCLSKLKKMKVDFFSEKTTKNFCSLFLKQSYIY